MTTTIDKPTSTIPTIARCGCKIETESGGEYARIVYCGFHGSASVLLAAARTALNNAAPVDAAMLRQAIKVAEKDWK